jgi:hypothetical protein
MLVDSETNRQIFPFNSRYKMGKAQSKRSCDITTEPSKEIQEGTGELKKIDESLINENESSVGDKVGKMCGI